MINSLLVLFNLFAAPCGGANNFFKFPTWYEYLPHTFVTVNQGTTAAFTKCIPSIGKFNDIWLVVAAMIDILLHVAALAAIFMIVYGGFRYVTSNGNPDNASKAQQTIINAVIGLILAVAASTIITFISGKFQG